MAPSIVMSACGCDRGAGAKAVHSGTKIWIYRGPCTVLWPKTVHQLGPPAPKLCVRLLPQGCTGVHVDSLVGVLRTTFRGPCTDA